MASFKLDENLSPSLKDLLQREGHDAATVADESLQGSADPEIADVCRAEGRCLITADEDFAQIIHYPPQEYPGIIVLRHPQPNLQRLRGLLSEASALLKREAVTGRLWIVEPGRVRIYEPSA